MSIAFPFHTNKKSDTIRPYPHSVDTDTALADRPGPTQPAVLTVVTRVEVDRDNVAPLHALMTQRLREFGVRSAETYVTPHNSELRAQAAVPVLPAAETESRVRISVPARVVTLDDAPVSLTRLEFDLLRYLREHPGEVHTREDLLRAVWDVDAEIRTRTVDVHVRRLRQKLHFVPGLISTVRGVGYRFDDTASVVVNYG